MDDVLFLQRKPDYLVVVARDHDGARIPDDRDQLGAWRKLERVSQSRQTGGDLCVGPIVCEPRLLTHGVLELIETEIGHPNIEGEIGADGENQEWEEAAERAHAATSHHCDCAPSMTSLTIRSIAILRPSATPRSSYWPSASSPFRCQSVLPVTWSTISMSTTS